MTNTDDLLPEGLEDKLPQEAEAITRAMRASLDVLTGQLFEPIARSDAAPVVSLAVGAKDESLCVVASDTSIDILNLKSKEFAMEAPHPIHDGTTINDFAMAEDEKSQD